MTNDRSPSARGRADPAAPPIEVAASARSRADCETVFALLKDGATWPTWSLFTGFELERAGRPDPLGVGAIRVFSTPVSRAREEVVEIREGRQLGYVLLSGLPLDGYRADVTLEPATEGGCRIFWRARFRPQTSRAGWFWRWFLARLLARVSRQLARAADARLAARQPQA